MALAVVVASVVATGCLSGDIDVTVHDDGSGEVRLEVVPSRELQQVLDQVDVESLADSYLDGIDGASFEPYERDGLDGYRMVVPFDDYGELTSLLVEGTTVAGQQIRLFSSIDLREVGDGWRLDAVLAPEIVGDALTAPPGLEELLATEGRAALGAGLDLSIALPGQVVNSNADEIDGGTATWRLEDLDGTTPLRMVTRPRDVPTTLQLVLAGALAALVLGVVLALWGAGRARRSETRRQIRAHEVAASDVEWQRPVVHGRPVTSNAPAVRPASLPPLHPPAPEPVVDTESADDTEPPEPPEAPGSLGQFRR
jgi:hypothetical protein